MRRLTLSLAACALAASAFCRIDYTVKLVPGANEVSVTIVAPIKGDSTSFQIPNWAPGSYRLTENRKNVQTVSATVDGKAATVSQVDDNTWQVAHAGGKAVSFHYGMKQNIPIGERIHLPGPSLYMYVVGRIKEDCTLTYDVPAGWQVANGLEPKGTGWVAPDYDVLADNPVSAGNLVIDTYTVQGVPHQIVYHNGDVSRVDRKKVVETCKFITEAQSNFWGGLPFKRYAWHFAVTPGQDGGGGLEHLSSTSISMAAGFGEGTVSVLSHEYFHAWNVKRMRAKVLGPFDYLVLPKTGALWLQEGVTDYYADLVLFRYGMRDADYMYRNVVGNVQRTRSNDQRMQVSPYDSSFRVGEAANGRGNSQGFGVNYYNTGWMLGLMLDIEIRSQTSGKYSLDDVMRHLYEQCKDNRPGFEEGDVRNVLMKYGGPALGPVYDKWVKTPGELPMEEQLDKIGLAMGSTDEQYVDAGFQINFGRQGGVRANAAKPDSPVQNADVILAVGSIDLTSAEPTVVMAEVARAQELLKKEEPVVVKLRRGETTSEVTVTPKKATRKVFKVWEKPDATKLQQDLRAGWAANPMKR